MMISTYVLQEVARERQRDLMAVAADQRRARAAVERPRRSRPSRRLPAPTAWRRAWRAGVTP